MNDVFSDTPLLPGFSLDPLTGALPSTARVYLVGGAVRDALLGLPITDRDWLVVGTDAQHMVSAGFIPVGGDFPVFLHPQTHEEYALARTERKSGVGYKGFVFFAAPDVSLTDDLRRRDLTINAMAADASGRLCDPWGGLADLQARRLRHVSAAFAEDPVRILRLARFAARYSDFSVDAATTALCQAMVVAGEAQHLVAERVWQELSGLLLAAEPALGFQVLHTIGVLYALFGSIVSTDRAQVLADNLCGVGVCQACSGELFGIMQLEQKFALWCLSAQLSELDVKYLSQAWKVPRNCAELAQLACRWFDEFKIAHQAKAVLKIFTALDLFRRPQRWQGLQQVWSYWLMHRQLEPSLPIAQWMRAASVLGSLEVAPLAQNAQIAGENVALVVNKARLSILDGFL